ncbi:hypothetical protein A3E13_02500 [Candidatus Woesebacteria bacterium RIFCSPHIGHO2_12_FULL_40_20]|nr:MAG: hypothetical protein A3E13_02500 [Candidatus Woesebacteria bacterium RIFCSPHIGHO2_12_FULL_40_20]
MLVPLGYQVTSFSNLTQAKQAFANEAWDVVICDGSVNGRGDGLDWADELYSQGQRVIVLAVFTRPRNQGISFIDKGEFNSDDLLRLVEY